MPTTAKICGLSTPATLDAAVAGGASHVGLVFFPPSPRFISWERAQGLASRVPSHVRIVGVFAEPVDKSFMDHAVTFAELDVIQIHKAEPERVDMLRCFSGLETWAAISVRTRADLDGAQRYAQAADRLLFDAKTPPGSTLPGGMGVRFDWALLDGFRSPLPWALSGGLDPANVADAIRRTGAPLVDVSSGVESAPGVKDVGRITAFLKAVYAA